MKNFKIKALIAAILLLSVSMLCLAGCKKANASDEISVNDVKYTVTETETDTVLIETADGSKIIIRLYPETAPITVENFKNLVSDGFYNGLTFHRIVEGFVIQGGDPNGDGTGGSGTAIKGEFALNGIKNDISHERGVVSMARRGNPYYDSATSQFFICLDASTCKSLDGQYAAFGRVIAGMDTVDKIVASKKGDDCRTMKTVRFVEIAE